jgi:ATP-binding cassette subfamily F protein 3
LKWGYGCQIGTYAQHVYGSLDPRLTVLETLEQNCDREITRQEVLAMAGALLFRDDHVNKKVKVLSGGERARLCMATLLLGTDNILVLDEPGTVIFTSHDRHFMRRVATCVIEVRDGTAKNYFGNYETYLQAVEQEVDEGERQRNIAAGKPASRTPQSGPTKGPSASDHRAVQQDNRRADKELKNLEKRIAKLDQQKRELDQRLLTETDPKEALRLHNELTTVNAELVEAEQRWLELNPF